MARLDDAAAKDIDETRRLLYMALAVGRTKKYNLAGTLINAIRHHQHADTYGDEPRRLEDQVIRYCNRTVDDASRMTDEEAAEDAWLRDQIQRCIDALGD